MSLEELTLRSVDGLTLGATLRMPDEPIAAAVLVHGGGGVDRHEWRGLYDRLSEHLVARRIATLQFDHRCYLGSRDSSIDITIAGVANDIAIATSALIDHVSFPCVHIVGGSFGGGAAALYTSQRPSSVASLSLLYPLLDYRQRLLDTKSWWDGSTVDEVAAARLVPGGKALRHVPGMTMSRALLNEAALLDPERLMKAVCAPTLAVRGTADERVPFAISAALAKLGAFSEFVAIEGAAHGFSLPNDVEHVNEQTHAFQNIAFERVAAWIIQHADLSSRL